MPGPIDEMQPGKVETRRRATAFKILHKMLL